MYSGYVRSLCLCLVEFLCAQVSCQIQNPRTRGHYCGMHFVGLVSIAGNIIIIVKLIKNPIIPQYMFLVILVYGAIIIMVLSHIITLFPCLMCHGHH